MTDMKERLKAAAEWLPSLLNIPLVDGCDAYAQRVKDAAYVLNLLAENKAVLCRAEPSAYIYDAIVEHDRTPLHTPFVMDHAETP